MSDAELTPHEQRRIGAHEAKAKGRAQMASLFEKTAIFSATTAAAAVAITGTALSHPGVHLNMFLLRTSIGFLALSGGWSFLRMAGANALAMMRYAHIEEILIPPKPGVMREGLEGIRWLGPPEGPTWIHRVAAFPSEFMLGPEYEAMVFSFCVMTYLIGLGCYLAFALNAIQTIANAPLPK